MLAVILPGILLIILTFVAASAYLIFRPERPPTIEEKAQTRQRARPPMVHRGRLPR